MPLLLDQLLYTSFSRVGFRTLASAEVPAEIQQAFLQQVVYKHWDSYNPPSAGYRAAYLHQLIPEHCLFGWLYSDGRDDLGRCHVPYFLCYYLNDFLQPARLENIFTCLRRGPVALIDQNSFPATLETLLFRDFWSYQPACLGVAIPSDVRKHSPIALQEGKLLDLFVPVGEEELVADNSISEVVVIKWQSLEKTLQALEALREGKIVIVNLTQWNSGEVQRAANCLADSTYAIGGQTLLIGGRTLLFAPSCVQVKLPRLKAEASQGRWKMEKSACKKIVLIP